MMTFNRLDSKCIDLNELAMELPEGRAKDAVLQAERLLSDVSLDIQAAMQTLRMGRTRAPDVHLRGRILGFQAGQMQREEMQIRQREATDGTNPPAA